MLTLHRHYTQSTLLVLISERLRLHWGLSKSGGDACRAYTNLEPLCSDPFMALEFQDLPYSIRRRHTFRAVHPLLNLGRPFAPRRWLLSSTWIRCQDFMS
jgi:hypothetical protein